MNHSLPTQMWNAELKQRERKKSPTPNEQINNHLNEICILNEHLITFWPCMYCSTFCCTATKLSILHMESRAFFLFLFLHLNSFASKCLSEHLERKKKNNYFRTRRRKKNTNCIFFLYEMLAKYDAIILLANGHRPFSATFIGSKRISVLNHFFLISNVPQVSVVVVFFLNPLKCANYKIDWNLWDGTVLNFAFLLQIN